MKYTYTPSKLLPGDGELLRQHAFTNWLSPDLHQAAANFMINVGLVAIYCECASDNRRRNILWHPPESGAIEFRSGRTLSNFEKLDQANLERGWPLLTLYINESDVYTAVWIAANPYEAAKQVLARYGITSAERTAMT
jgi:hypothetical protein